MCFTPWVSLTTAIIEFFVGTFILTRYKNNIVSTFSAIFIYILGFYQFTEFMLCTNSYTRLWVILGFSAYSFLPAIGLHMVIKLTREKFNNYVWYIPPIIFSLIAFLKDNFVISAGCNKIFVAVSTTFTNQFTAIPHNIYIIYYFGFISISCFLLISHIKKQQMKKIYIWWFVTFIITATAPLLLMDIIPHFYQQFPSIYCEFAIFFSITALVTSEMYCKEKKRKKN